MKIDYKLLSKELCKKTHGNKLWTSGVEKSNSIGISTSLFYKIIDAKAKNITTDVFLKLCVYLEKNPEFFITKNPTL